MVMGEHVVLQGAPALVAALDVEITVRVVPLSVPVLRIESALGKYECLLDAVLDTKPPSLFSFVLESLKWFCVHRPEQWKARKHAGLILHISSGFSDQMGFASSAAVTVATLRVFNLFLEDASIPIELERNALAVAGRSVVLNVQGIGSGADIAASVFGGVVFYGPLEGFNRTIFQIAQHIPLTVLYSGYKTPTVEVVRGVARARMARRSAFEKIDQSMAACVYSARTCVENSDWQSLGQLSDQYYGLQKQMGVSDTVLDQLVLQLKSDPHVYGAKISGSGLGDCVIGIGVSPALPGLPVKIQHQGVRSWIE